MKQIKNDRGFTLIELLAVIVVLAIVLLMGAMAVIPRMNDARRQAFALEANTAIQGASTWLLNNALKSGGVTFPTNPDTPVCVPISKMIEDGILDFDDDYKGRVIVKRLDKNSNTYLYQISMTNGTLGVLKKGVVDNKNVDITSDMVFDKQATFDEYVGTDFCSNKEIATNNPTE